MSLPSLRLKANADRLFMREAGANAKDWGWIGDELFHRYFLK